VKSYLSLLPNWILKIYLKVKNLLKSKKIISFNMSLYLFSFSLLSLGHPTSKPNPDPFPFPMEPFSCSKLDSRQCLNTYMCGWCENSTYCDDDDIWNNSTNTTGNGNCVEIGYCDIGAFVKYDCKKLFINDSCFIVKACLSVFFLIITLNLVFCTIKSIHIPLVKSNYSNSCKQFTLSMLYSVILIPIVYYYFVNFSIFIYLMFGSAILGVIFWCLYGGSAAIRIVNNRNFGGHTSAYDSINNETPTGRETDSLLRN